MAPSQSTLHDLGNEKNNNDPIPLPLVPVDRKPPARNECQEFTLKMDPADTSPHVVFCRHGVTLRRNDSFVMMTRPKQFSFRGALVLPTGLHSFVR